MLIAILFLAFYFLFFRGKASANLYENGSFTSASVVSDVQNEDGSITQFSTINKLKAQSVADQLYQRLYGDTYTSDSDILNLLKGFNEADYKLIESAFGFRPSGVFGLNGDLDLTAYIIKDVTEKGVKTLSKQFPNIF